MKQNTFQHPMLPDRTGKIVRILVLVLFFAAVFCLLNRVPWDGTTIPLYEGSGGHMEESWVFCQGDAVLESHMQTPAFRKMEAGQTYSISAMLTYDGSRDYMPYCFYFVDHMFTAVYLDGQEIFSYMPEDIHKPDPSKSPGNVYVSVPLPQDCLGRELRIDFIPALDADIDYQLPNPNFGNYTTIAYQTFWADYPHNIIAILAAILGIAAILFSTLALRGSKYREGIFIGIFATLFSFYNITESDFNFYAISNPYYTYLLDYTTFSLIPVFLIAFLRERLDEKPRKVASAMIGVGIFMFVTELILHFSGIMDMREYLTILHIVYLIDFLIIFVLLITMKRNRWKRQLIFQLLPIMLGALMDAAIYYLHWQLGTSDSTFTALGVIAFLIAELVHVWKYSVEVYTESIRSHDYREMAYIDALTGIGNRRAYDAEKRSIYEKQREFNSLTVASVDINYLKHTNDTMGHAAGDFLIRNAAEVLTDFAEDFGSAFRIGGDEFIVFLYDMSQETLTQRLEQMQLQMDAINANSEAKLSLAVGYVPMENDHLDDAIQQADKKMYVHKARIKGEPVPETK